MSKEDRVSSLKLASSQKCFDESTMERKGYKCKPIAETPVVTVLETDIAATAILQGGRNKTSIITNNEKFVPNPYQQDSHIYAELSIPCLALYERNDDFDDFIEQALIDTTEELEQNLEKLAQHLIFGFDIGRSGSTAAIVVQDEDKVSVLSLGDSGVECYRPYKDDYYDKLLRLSINHTPISTYNDDEYERAQSQSSPTFPIWDVHRLESGLAVSRAFGDTDSKKYGLSNTPEITCRTIQEEDYLICATDGLTDYVTRDDAYDVLEGQPQAMAEALATKAALHGTHDNTTVQVVKFKKLPKGKIKVYGVFDGHGPDGHRCSQWLANNFSAVLQKNIETLEFIQTAMRELKKINTDVELDPNSIVPMLRNIYHTTLRIKQTYSNKNNFAVLDNLILKLRAGNLQIAEYSQILKDIEKNYGALGKRLIFDVFVIVILLVATASVLFFPFGAAAFLGISATLVAAALVILASGVGYKSKRDHESAKESMMLPLFNKLISETRVTSKEQTNLQIDNSLLTQLSKKATNGGSHQ